VNAVLGALDSAGIRAADVGVVEEGAGVTVDGDPLAEPDSDPLWPAYQAARERFRE